MRDDLSLRLSSPPTVEQAQEKTQTKTLIRGLYYVESSWTQEGAGMAKGNVLPFADRKAQAQRNGSFLELIESDIKANPAKVVPIPQDFFDRMDALRAKAESNRREELIEM